MPQFELILPKMGESVAEATIIKWLKQVGEEIREDDILVEISTDKVDSEVPSPVSGIIKQLFFSEDDIAQVGDVIAIIETGGKPTGVNDEIIQQSKPEESNVIETKLANLETKTVVEEPKISFSEDNTNARFYSPLVKSIAVEEGISFDELNTIPGTGADSRVTKQDLLNYIAKRSLNHPVKEPIKPQETPSDSFIKSPVSPRVSGSDEIIEMDRMRKLISEHMVMSVQTAPHVTSFVETDVTNIVRWREKNKDSFEKSVGEKITYTPIFIQAVAKAIRDFPMINISLEGTQIIKKKDINIGIAAALPSGNLIVPVIKKADQLNLIGLTKAVNDLGGRSKNNKLQPDEVKDGTFTITNIGSFGNIMGTPIINQPQVAILAIGVIQKKPAVIETEYGDMVGIRHKLFLSLSYDHRIVDGALGGMFLKKISDYLEAWDINYKV